MLIKDMREEWRVLDRRIAAFDDEFAARAKNDKTVRRLATIPGIGVLNATALAAAIGEGETFARGRDLAAWLGLVPRQITTGGKPRLVGITKRRQLLSPQVADPRRQGCSPYTLQERDSARRMVARASGEGAQERRRRRIGEQACPHRVGRVAA